MIGRVADPVWRRAVPAAGHPVEHVADVADERAGQRWRGGPAFGRGDLKPAAVVLSEQGQQPVVGVLAHPPAVIGRRRVVKDPEQDGRVRGVSLGEVPGVEAKAERHAAQHGLAQAGQRVQIGEHERAQPRHLAREQVAAVQRETRDHPRIIGRQLGTEVQPLLQVRPPGGELGAHREVAAPRPAAALHCDLHLVRHRQREELASRCRELAQQVSRHAVPGHVEEAALAAGRLDLPGYRRTRRRWRVAGQRGHVDDRQPGGAAGVSRGIHPDSGHPPARCRSRRQGLRPAPGPAGRAWPAGSRRVTSRSPR